MAKAKKGAKKGTRRKSSGGKSGFWMDKAKLAGGLLATLTAVTMADRWREGKSLNPFSMDYYRT